MLENDKTLNQGLSSNALQYNINSGQNKKSGINGVISSILSVLGGNIIGGATNGFSTGDNYGFNNQVNNM